MMIEKDIERKLLDEVSGLKPYLSENPVTARIILNSIVKAIKKRIVTPLTESLQTRNEALEEALRAAEDENRSLCEQLERLQNETD